MQNKLTELHGLELIVVIGAWLAGILLESWVSLPAFALLAGACAALLWLIPLWRDRQARLIMFIILWLLLGAWRLALVSPTVDAQAISAFIGTGKVEVQGTVADEPKLAGRSRLLLITVSSVSKNGGTTGKMHTGNWKPRHWVEKSRIPMDLIMATMLSYRGSFRLPYHTALLLFLPAWPFHASMLIVLVVIPSLPPSIISALYWQLSSHNHSPSRRQRF